jgi:hypothetical protein
MRSHLTTSPHAISIGRSLPSRVFQNIFDRESLLDQIPHFLGEIPDAAWRGAEAMKMFVVSASAGRALRHCLPIEAKPTTHFRRRKQKEQSRNRGQKEFCLFGQPATLLQMITNAPKPLYYKRSKASEVTFGYATTTPKGARKVGEGGEGNILWNCPAA